MRGRVEDAFGAEQPPIKRPRNGENGENSKDDANPTSEERSRLAKLVEARRNEVIELQEEVRVLLNKLDDAKRKLASAENIMEQVQKRDQKKNAEKNTINKATISVKLESDSDVTMLHTETTIKPPDNELEPGVPKPTLVIPASKGSPLRTGAKSNTMDTSASKLNPSVVQAASLPVVPPSTSKLNPPVVQAASLPLVLPSKASMQDVSIAKPKSSGTCQQRPQEARCIKSSNEIGMKPKLTGAPQKEHVDLIPIIRSSSAPQKFMVSPFCISSQHRRKLRSLYINPASDQHCVTSALDGVVNFWQIQSKGQNLQLLNSVDCPSPGQRRWPEDLAWHPSGDRLFAVYSADGGDYQVSIIRNSRQKGVEFLESKPHEKGIINSIDFMPWQEGSYFVTGGSDHGVILWSEKDGSQSWQPKVLHRSMHSSSVQGVAGTSGKQLVMSVGMDKRIVGYDVRHGRAAFQHLLDSKALGILPNPVDFNLFMVQTGLPGKQLRLFDARTAKASIHTFGWKQEQSESQSALINQSWSPDGLYIASGSTDPKIHLFDIRYNSSEPAQTIQVHQKRVFKAAWHHSLPLLISISSDLQIGLHRI